MIHLNTLQQSLRGRYCMKVIICGSYLLGFHKQLNYIIVYKNQNSQNTKFQARKLQTLHYTHRRTQLGLRNVSITKDQKIENIFSTTSSVSTLWVFNDQRNILLKLIKILTIPPSRSISIPMTSINNFLKHKIFQRKVPSVKISKKMEWKNGSIFSMTILYIIFEPDNDVLRYQEHIRLGYMHAFSINIINQ